MTDINASAQNPKFGRRLFHKASLIPFFAFVGLGADSISSSCYGPEEAFLSLAGYPHLIIFVGLLSMLTISVLSTSYSQIIELFPYGGGGYVVASKLLSPVTGVVSGAALLVDYVLTVTISIAAGVDAIFSFLPVAFLAWRLPFKVAAILAMTLLNIRGVKESVFPWIPVILLFGFTHLFAFLWAFLAHFDGFIFIEHGVSFDINRLQNTVGTFGVLFILLKSYSMGAGTYTGIEAVSNSMNIFREPRVPNARRTMFYMSISLAVMVTGFMLSYLLYHVEPQYGQTLNGVLLHAIGAEMPPGLGTIFATVTLFTEAAILVMAAQSGFLGGPRVLANMAADRWLPNRFTNLSDRFVMRHGILLMSLAALLLMVYSEGHVAYLVVLYSLAVFITFTTSQLGMAVHWSKERLYNRPWLKGLIINGVGCVLTLFILISLAIIKFEQGAWLILAVISLLTYLCYKIKAYYSNFSTILEALPTVIPERAPVELPAGQSDRSLHTAVLFVSGYSPLSLHSIGEIVKLFGNSIEHFVFLHVGVIDAGAFKGERAIKFLEEHTQACAAKLVKEMQHLGYSAESAYSVGLDLADEIAKLAQEVRKKHPSSIFLGGHLVLAKETTFSRWMHNQTLYSIQRRIFELEYPFVTVPVYLKGL